MTIVLLFHALHRGDYGLASLRELKKRFGDQLNCTCLDVTQVLEKEVCG